jgi:hypothetical protein
MEGDACTCIEYTSEYIFENTTVTYEKHIILLFEGFIRFMIDLSSGLRRGTPMNK